MSAYIVVDCEVIDSAKYDHYKQLSPAAIARYGGRFLARGGTVDVLEGDWKPSRLVILEFPSLAAAKTFYDSPEYREARRVRAGAAKMKLVAIEGVPQSTQAEQ